MAAHRQTLVRYVMNDDPATFGDEIVLEREQFALPNGPFVVMRIHPPYGGVYRRFNRQELEEFYACVKELLDHPDPD